MMHSTQSLYDNLGGTLLEINKQMDAVKRRVLGRFPDNQAPDADIVYNQMHANGVPVLQDLLLAKANVLSAMANLKAAETMSHIPAARRQR